MFGVTLEDPEVAFVPDQAPEAVQDVALVEDQVSVEDPLYDTDVGLAEKLRVGAGIEAPKTLNAIDTPITKINIIKNFLYVNIYFLLIC